MIVILIGLLLLLQPERIYHGALSYAPLERVVINRQWDNTQFFDILLATENCNDLARWAWVITEDGEILEGVIVDCESPLHKGQLTSRGLVADMNLKDKVGIRAWLIIR